VQYILVHSPDCPNLADNQSELHIAVREMDSLVVVVHNLMRKYEIPFHRVEPHNASCPGTSFPWEDLEFQLFMLEH